MSEKEYTYADVTAHNTKKDLFVVIHDKVYNASSFVDEHPYVASQQIQAHELQISASFSLKKLLRTVVMIDEKR
jgi:hypothetical protein